MKIFKKIGIYYLLKYFIFILTLTIVEQNFSIFRIDKMKSVSDFYLYFFLILFFPVLNFILFCLPIFYTFKLNKNLRILCNLILILIEIMLYVYFTSQKINFEIQNILLFFISITLFSLIFRRELLSSTK